MLSRWSPRVTRAAPSLFLLCQPQEAQPFYVTSGTRLSWSRLFFLFPEQGIEPRALCLLGKSVSVFCAENVEILGGQVPDLAA